jgi:hypothetical protein
MLSAGEPLLSRAQQAGAVDPDITISDVVKLVSGVAAVASYDSPAQRERVLNLAINAIRR